MKPNKFNLTIVLAIICALTAFSQPKYEEHVFVYKVVNGHEIKANIFIPETGHVHPVVVYFHGGGFMFGNRDEGLESALRDKLLANDYAVVSADYRLAPETKLAGIIGDAADVINWLTQNGAKQFQIDFNKIAAAGGSAGGYLALTTGYIANPPPKVIISISAPTANSDVNNQNTDESVLNQPGPYHIVKDSVVSYGDYSTRVDLWKFLSKNRLFSFELFGFDVSKDTARLLKYSLTNHIKKEYPPTLIVHAKNDQLIQFSEAEQFYNFLKMKGVQSELFIAKNGHSSELINTCPEALDKVVQFLDAHLK
jgi:acetyl esterase/lipase